MLGVEFRNERRNFFNWDRWGELDIHQTDSERGIIARVVGIDDIAEGIPDADAIPRIRIDVLAILRRDQLFIIVFPVIEGIVIEDA